MDDLTKNPNKSDSAGSASADAGNGIEVRALLLQESNGKWFWGVVVDGCGGCDGTRHRQAVTPTPPTPRTPRI